MRVSERNAIKAWHFLQDFDGRPAMRSGDDVPVEHSGVVVYAGNVIKHRGPLVMCSKGLHASERIRDALGYAKSAWLSRVECWGEVLRDEDKLVCTRRRVLWVKDVTLPLHSAACEIAEHALLRAGITDQRSWDAIKTKRRWLLGNATDDELEAAYSAAVSAAVSATVSATVSAAVSAACYAAYRAAYGAAVSAACYAAYSRAAMDEWNALITARILE